MEAVETVVIGAGVVGLAVARRLAMAGQEVLVLEAAGRIGTETSSRNSEVIHAGIYYPPGSLMARLCVPGRRMLYAYCEAHGVRVRRCGKLIVATAPAEEARLGGILARAESNGVEDIQPLSAAAAMALEPELRCTAALLSPSTGILDAHGYMLCLHGEALAHGALFAFHAPVIGAATGPGGFVVDVGGAEPMSLRCRKLVNAAGLHAPALARRIAGLRQETIPDPYYAKGSYFTLSAPSPFTRLIYPVPEPGGLGVHLTLDLAGRARFGPDVEWVDRIDYTVDPRRADAFYAAVRRYWPGLADRALQPGYAGIRPKIVPPAAAAQDFLISDATHHGLPGLVNLFGIESPGLTCSLPLAEEVIVRL